MLFFYFYFPPLIRHSDSFSFALLARLALPGNKRHIDGRLGEADNRNREAQMAFTRRIGSLQTYSEALSCAGDYQGQVLRISSVCSEGG